MESKKLAKAVELDPDYFKKKHYLDNVIEKVKALPEPNRSTILDFHKNYSVLRENRIGTQLKNLFVLRRLVLDFKINLSKLSHADIQRVRVAWAEKRTVHSLAREINVIKALIKHTGQTHLLNTIDNKGPNQSLKTPKPYDTLEGRILSEQIPTPEEVARLIEHLTPKYKGVVALLYGNGMRVSAVRFLKRQNVESDPDGGMTVSFTSKGSNNRVWLRNDLAQFVLNWMNQSPFKTPESFVFSTTKGKILTNAAIAKAIRIAADKADWPKVRKQNPHVFRHCAVLELQRKGVSQTFIRKRFWNNAKTRMPDIAYMHLDDTDANNAIKDVYGVGIKAKPVDPFQARVCFACSRSHAFNKAFCECGAPLDPAQVAQKVSRTQELEAKMMAMQEQMQMLMLAVKTKL